MKTVLLVATLLLATGTGITAVAATPDPPARTAWMRRACVLEDSIDCFWNAAQQGDGRGHSFYVHRFPGGAVCTMYVDPSYSRHHDSCRHASGVRGHRARMTVPGLTLNNAAVIPQLGFGVFQVPPEQTAATVGTAFEVGYRHIDTAQMYGNEQEVGVAIAASDIPRDELWITSKLNNGYHRPDDARRAFDETLDKLGLDHIDLFLIHWPLPTLYDGDFVSTWQTLTEFVGDGRARAVGVSNFQPAHLERIVAETGVVPAVNQIEVHPYFGNEAARTASLAHGILVEAWSPIAQGGVLEDETIGKIAADHDRSPSQVTLRWHVQRGDIIFPKSMREERMRENFGIFDFDLDDVEMAAITALDRDEEGRNGPNPDTFDMVPD